MSTLLVNGCSFMWGMELQDRDNRWSMLWADHFLLAPRMTDLSAPASSNARIFRTTVDYVTTHEVDCVLVQWSFNSRAEFFCTKNNQWIPFVARKIVPDRNDLQTQVFEHLYWDRFSSPQTSADTTARLKFALACILNQMNIPFLFINGAPPDTDLLKDETVTVSPQTSAKLSVPTMDEDFYTFSKTSGLPRGPQFHPLEEAHKAWATKVINYTEQHNEFFRTCY